MTETVSYTVVKTTRINRRKNGSVSFWKGVVDRGGGRHYFAKVSNKVGQADILSDDGKTVWLPADHFKYSDMQRERDALVARSEAIVRDWDGVDIWVLAAACIAARDEHTCTPDRLATLAYESHSRGQGWQGEIPHWDDIIAADITGLALVWSDTNFDDVRQIPVDG